MSVRTFALKFIGDETGLTKKFHAVGKDMDEFTGKVDKQHKGLSKLSTTLKGGVAGAVVGVTAFLGSSVKAAVSAEVAQGKLEKTLKAAGTSWHAHADQITAVIEKTSDLSGLTDTDLKGAFTNIVRVTGDHPGGVAQALRLTGLAADIARAKHIDVAKAGELVGKVAGGNTGILARYGIVIDKGSTSTQALGALQHKFAGQAKAYGETTAGAQDRFKAAVNRLQVEVGTKLLPVLTKLLLALVYAVDHVDDVRRAVINTSQSIVRWVGDLPEKMGAAIKASPGALLDAGKWIMEQIWKGFKAAPGAILDAAKWLKDKVVEAVKDAFGIGSPSKVFEQLGQNMTAGLIKGIDPGRVAAHIARLGAAGPGLAAARAPGMAGWFAGGGDFVTSGPTVVGVGEAGPERVTITPLGRGGGGVQIRMDRPVFLSPRHPDAFGRRLAWRLATT